MEKELDDSQKTAGAGGSIDFLFQTGFDVYRTRCLPTRNIKTTNLTDTDESTHQI